MSTLSSWPIAVLILVLVFFFTFKESISEWIKKLWVKTPKGYEFSSQPQMEAKRFSEKEREELRKIFEAEKKDMGAKPFDKKESEGLKEKFEAEKKDMASSFWTLIEFERTIRILFRSQFLMMKFLSASKTIKFDVQKAYIEDNYYKNIYLKGGGNPGYSFDSYLNFLEMGGYIFDQVVINISMIRITDKGESFLLYCSLSNYAENLFIPI